MKTVFAIPSLGRPEGVKKNTIQNLHNLGVPKESIFVFVANESEEESYRHALGGEYNIVVGLLGIGNQRAFINAYFEKETRIVSLDDDVTLMKKVENKVELLEEPLIPLVTRAFDMCDELGCRYWGIPDYTNGMFLKHQVVHGMRHCAGSFYGEYAQEPESQSLRPHGEDVDKQIKHFLRYNGILRLNDIAVKQKRYSDGGVNQHLGGEDNRLVVLEQNALEMAKEYPEIFIMKEKYDLKKGVHKIKIITHGRYPSLLS